MDWIEQKWRGWIRPWFGGPNPVSVGWAMVSSMYAGRAYHNLHHVSDMLRLFDENSEMQAAVTDPERRFGLEAAIWFHDIIYDVKAKPGDNEFLSGVCAEMFLLSLRDRREMPNAVVSTLWACVHATRHDRGAVGAEDAVMIDLDLAGLSSERSVYIGNSIRIRAEYAHLSDPEWWKGRAAFLRSMLERPTIYQLPRFREAHEAIARANIQAEIEYVERRLASS